MRIILSAIVIALGIILLATSLGIVRTVDSGLPPAREAATPLVGPAQAQRAPQLDPSFATRFTVLGVVVAIVGGVNLIVGAQLLAIELIRTRARKSRLGTDPPD